VLRRQLNRQRQCGKETYHSKTRQYSRPHIFLLKSIFHWDTVRDEGVWAERIHQRIEVWIVGVWRGRVRDAGDRTPVVDVSGAVARITEALRPAQRAQADKLVMRMFFLLFLLREENWDCEHHE
jgi:hypothetical protein